MRQIKTRSHPVVKLIHAMGDDSTVAMAAKVSFDKHDDPRLSDEDHIRGLINFLVKNKHHSTLEHCQFTFYIECPLFVRSEIMRHRTCVTGDTVVRLASPNGVKNSRHKTIATIWENWHLGVPDQSPKERQVNVVYRKREGNWRVSYVYHDGKTADGRDNRGVAEVGIFDTESEALAAAEPYRTTWRRRKLPSTRNIYAVSVDEETGKSISNRIVDVRKMGVKPVVKITTLDGRSLRLTADHEVRTPNGYVPAGELQSDDVIHVIGTYGVSSPDPLVSKELRAGIGHWSSRERRLRLSRIPTSEKVECYLCENKFDRDDVELDHVVPVVKDLKLALDSDNLEFACTDCHRKKTNIENAFKRGGLQAGAVEDVILSVVPDGEEEVYDLEMEAPNHNFTANGIIVHNCSFNEVSARYSTWDFEFHVPSPDRPLVQSGKPGAYHFIAGDETQYAVALRAMERSYQQAIDSYDQMVEAGIAKEVARNTLPVGTYTKFYMSLNARNLMHFLGLRLDPTATDEIRRVAQLMEAYLEERMPITYAAWKDSNA